MGLSTLVWNTMCLNSLFQTDSIHSSCTLPSLEGIQLMKKQVVGWHSFNCVNVLTYLSILRYRWRETYFSSDWSWGKPLKTLTIKKKASNFPVGFFEMLEWECWECGANTKKLSHTACQCCHMQSWPTGSAWTGADFGWISWHCLCHCAFQWLLHCKDCNASSASGV